MHHVMLFQEWFLNKWDTQVVHYTRQRVSSSGIGADVTVVLRVRQSVESKAYNMQRFVTRQSQFFLNKIPLLHNAVSTVHFGWIWWMNIQGMVMLYILGLKIAGLA